MELPLWYTFKVVSDAEINRSDSYNLVQNRILLLSGKTHSRVYKQEIHETSEEFEKRSKEELMGHVLLRLASSINLKLSSWLIESEGDLFYDRFSHAIFEEKEKILNHLYSTNNWKSLSELSEEINENLARKLQFFRQFDEQRVSRVSTGYKVKDTKGMNNIVCIHFTSVPYLLKQRRHFMYKGWVIAPLKKFLTTIKKGYEKMLAKRIEEIGENVRNNSELSTTVSVLNNLLKNDYLAPLIQPKYPELSLDNIKIEINDAKSSFILPPCIQDLIERVDETGYLEHWHRFQLGIFFKVTGMGIEDQLQYWYSKVVDNIGMSFSDFKSKAGYIIRHIYGLEGGNIDYDMPSCKTIIDKMHCSFKDNNIETIDNKLVKLIEKISDEDMKKNKKIAKERIKQASLNLNPRQACYQFLEFISEIDTSDQKIISHPLQYLKEAQKRSIKL